MEALVETPAEVRQRAGRRTWLKRTALVLVLALITWTIVRNRGELLEALRDIHPAALVIAFLLGIGAMLSALQVWRSVAADLGSPLPNKPAARVFYLSQLGKYVPGSIWSIISQVELGREHKMPRRTGATVGILAVTIGITAGLAMGALLLPLAAAEAGRKYWWVALLVPIFLIGLHPEILGRLLNFVLRVLRREPLPATPTWPGMGRALGFQVIVWTLFGLQIWVLLIGLGARPGPALAASIGGYALAHSLGLLAIGLPAGAGVREAVLVVTLSTVVSPATALLVALLSRAIGIVVDLGMALIQHLFNRHHPTAP